MPRLSTDPFVDTEPPIYVAPSRTGRGVFAARALVLDEILGEVRGTIVQGRGYGSEYCIEIDAGRVLEPDAPWKYVNHSCDPNCEVFSWEETEGDITPDRMWLVTLREIRPGEELTIDYAWSADAAIPCRCGSPKCRGWVVDEAELDKMPPRHECSETNTPAADSGTCHPVPPFRTPFLPAAD
jgi:hypothetical protein